MRTGSKSGETEVEQMSNKNSDSKQIAKQMLEFIHKSPTCFHVIGNLKEKLLAEGFKELKESDEWKLKAGKFFVIRNDSSIISFKIPGKNFKGFYMIASHSDSPSFKIKENPEMESVGAYIKLNTEKYGGMLMAPWFDRPLSVAGRLIVKGKKKDIKTKLVNVDRDLLMIPSLAIHMNRDVNSGYKYNPQVDTIPLYGDMDSKDTFMDVVAKSAGVKKEDILSHDLFLYNRVKPTLWGANEEFIGSSRIDDQECVYTTFEGFIQAKESDHVAVHCVFDNEEVGSGTKQAADSSFLKDTLVRINEGLGRSNQQYYTAIADSFMISADNAHGVHPNYADKADPVNIPVMNKGIVIKYNANQKYTTDAVSAAFFKLVCQEAGVPYQAYTNRSDVAGGATLGNLATVQVSARAVDIGLAQLAMHSPYETAGSLDPEYLIKASKVFYEK